MKGQDSWDETDQRTCPEIGWIKKKKLKKKKKKKEGEGEAKAIC